MNSPIPVWLGLLVGAAVFTVMLALGLMLGPEQVAAARQRRRLLLAALFVVVVPLPAAAVLLVKAAGIKGAVAAGILLMAISPGAPIAVRRAIEAGGNPAFAPTLHLAVVAMAIVTVPASMAILSAMYGTHFSISPGEVARQVFFAQLLPLAIGAMFRAVQPAQAARLEALLRRVANVMLSVLSLALLYVLWPLLVETGWAPFTAGVALTTCALGLGAAIAAADAPVRPAVAVATAMRNPGIALLIATVNQMPASVVAAVFSYALGLALVIGTFVAWRSRRAIKALST